MHKIVGGRPHFDAVSCFAPPPAPSSPSACCCCCCCCCCVHIRLWQHSPTLQIARDPECAKAWAALGAIVFLHSSDDRTVPASSSVLLHEALAGRGVRSRLLLGTGPHCAAIMGNGCVVLTSLACAVV